MLGLMHRASGQNSGAWGAAVRSAMAFAGLVCLAVSVASATVWTGTVEVGVAANWLVLAYLVAFVARLGAARFQQIGPS
jgi:hypothetical protein